MLLRKLLLLTALAGGLGHCQPTRHDRIFVVPCKGPVTLDGDLKEWDLSGALEASFDEALRPKFTMRAALMDDAEALYIGCHFSDDTPMVNHHDPAVEVTRGWDADCLQVRLCSDPVAPYPLPNSNSERICHLMMWYFTDQKLPVLQLQYGMDYHGTVVLTGAQSGVAFRQDPDGQGYTLEARIPWSLLHAPGAPKPNDRLALVLQPQWGDAAGWKSVATFNDPIREAGFSFIGAGVWGQAIFLERGDLPASGQPPSVAQQAEPLELSLRLPDARATTVSAAILDAGGMLVRTLPVTTGARIGSGGRLALRWDGLDDDGRPLPPGRYTARALSHRDIGQRWVASLHNAGNPPWRTDDGTGSWGGDHGSPVAAVCDAGRVYLGWTLSEAGWSMIAVDKALTAEGRPRKLWGQHQVLDIGMCVTALATDGERLFVAQDGKGWGAPRTRPAAPRGW